jgi:hypothetical protein
VDISLIEQLGFLIKRYNLSTEMRKHLEETRAQHPVVTQRAYSDFVNVLDRFVKAGSQLGVAVQLLDDGRYEV